MPRGDETRRMTLRLPRKTARRIEEYASRNALSITQATDQLIWSGLDAELAGIATIKDLGGRIDEMMGWVRSSLEAGDVAAALLLDFMKRAAAVDEDEGETIDQLYLKARNRVGYLFRLKKNSPIKYSR